MSFWPGLSRTWQGSLLGLAIALGFAVLLEFALLTTLVWPQCIGRPVQVVVWLIVAAYWLFGAGRSLVRGSPALFGDPVDSAARMGLFCKAQTEYLKGNWFSAERLLQEVLRRDKTDVDARLLLATLYRHVDRPKDARRQLARVCDMPGGEEKWGLEVRRERELLARRGTASREQREEKSRQSQVSGAA
jgi:hypothetical protein